MKGNIFLPPVNIFIYMKLVISGMVEVTLVPLDMQPLTFCKWIDKCSYIRICQFGIRTKAYTDIVIHKHVLPSFLTSISLWKFWCNVFVYHLIKMWHKNTFMTYIWGTNFLIVSLYFEMFKALGQWRKLIELTPFQIWQHKNNLFIVLNKISMT